MFDIGWMEMMVIAIVMIVIIGPKELPVVLHTMGRWIGRVRAMARSFQDSIEEMAQESGLDDVRREVDSITDYDIGGAIEKSVDPGGEIRKELTHGGSEDLPKPPDGAAPPEKRKTAKGHKDKTREAEAGEPTPPPMPPAGQSTGASDDSPKVAGDKP
ncbi:MAG: Sec-independent protein translocase protein TatB [Alphaproteobacteria bacterium]|nr:Sec-independent protein translocase protein TatB [Alphaproteobacteria bacterium]